MKDEVQQVFKVLNDAGVRYVVAGGLAVIAHGYLRLTMDVDLVIDLEHDNILKGLIALERVGYKPRLPVAHEQFADAKTRESWIRDKNMLVFPLWNPDQMTGLMIDVFVECPFDFEEEYSNVKWMETDEGENVPFVGLDCLLRMKKEAARPKDLIDIEYLNRVQQESRTNER
jgi:predicted nucleotidyltransferase